MKQTERIRVSVENISGLRWLVSAGVFWFVWGARGFWWGVLYAVFWPVWLGFRMAETLWR